MTIKDEDKAEGAVKRCWLMKTASNNRMFWEAVTSLTGAEGESSHPSWIKTSVDTMITAGGGNHQHEVLYTSLPANGWGAP